MSNNVGSGSFCVDCGTDCTRGRSRCRACATIELSQRLRCGVPKEPTEAEVEATISAQLARPLPAWFIKDRATPGDGERMAQNWESTPHPIRTMLMRKRWRGVGAMV